MLLGDFFFSITKGLPKIVAKLLHKAQKYMNVEDAVVPKEIMGKKGREMKKQVVTSRRKRRCEAQGKS